MHKKNRRYGGFFIDQAFALAGFVLIGLVGLTVFAGVAGLTAAGFAAS